MSHELRASYLELMNLPISEVTEMAETLAESLSARARQMRAAAVRGK